MRKRVALKGFVALAISIALCAFFSQTIMTITTAKVNIIAAKRGKLEDKIPLVAELWYPSSEAFTLDQAKNLPAVVESIYVRAGDEVKAGDLLFTTRLLPGADEAVKKAKDELIKAQDAQLKTAQDYARSKIKDTVKNQALRDLVAAREAQTALQAALIAEAHEAGIELSADPSKWPEQLSGKAEGKLLALWGQMPDAAQVEADALAAYIAAHRRYGTPTNFTATKKIDDEAAAEAAARAALLKLEADMANLRSVRAPRAGIVVKLDVAPGDSCPSDKAAFTLAAGKPAMRADISEVSRELRKEMAVDIKREYGTLKTKVQEVRKESASKRWAIIEITDDMLNELGGYRGLTGEKLDMTVAYHGKVNGSILPANAVRTENGASHILAVEEQNSFWGQEMRVKKREVHVIEKSDTQVAVEEDLMGVKIADGEDRGIEDNSRVMEYLSQK